MAASHTASGSIAILLVIAVAVMPVRLISGGLFSRSAVRDPKLQACLNGSSARREEQADDLA